MVKGTVGTPMNDVGSKLINFDIKVPCFCITFWYGKFLKRVHIQLVQCSTFPASWGHGQSSNASISHTLHNCVARLTLYLIANAGMGGLVH